MVPSSQAGPDAARDTAPVAASRDTDWQRLDPRTIAVSGLVAAGACVAGGVPTVTGVLRGGTASWGVVLTVVLVVVGTVLVVAAAIGAESLRLRRARYRITADRVDLESGLFVHHRRGLARDRIRSVELTADPLLRVAGLVAVQIGTGQQVSATDKPLLLKAVRRVRGEELREVLLARAPVRDHGDDPGAHDGTLAEFDPAWVRYAPLSSLTVALGAAAVGAVLQGADWFGLREEAIDAAAREASALGIVLSIVVGVAAVLVVGVVASAALFVEYWWRYRLVRETDGTLRVQRGLLTRRSISLEERRVRGVAVVEPLGVRTAGAARVDVVATGLSRDDQQKSDPRTLLPAAPRALADRVAADVLREPVAPTTAVRLRPHPRAARTRRLRRGVAAGLAPAAVLALLGVMVTPVLAVVAAPVAVVGVAIGVSLGLEAARNLGHGLTGAYVVTRSGVLRRRTVALRRDGVVGWAVRQTVLQRRAGLITVLVTTAAGDGSYTIPDVDAVDGLAFAREALGPIVTPFLIAL